MELDPFADSCFFFSRVIWRLCYLGGNDVRDVAKGLKRREKKEKKKKRRGFYKFVTCFTSLNEFWTFDNLRNGDGVDESFGNSWICTSPFWI